MKIKNIMWNLGKALQFFCLTLINMNSKHINIKVSKKNFNSNNDNSSN